MPALIRELAVASGSQWLIGGQVADLEGEGKKIIGAELKYIHRCKTAALLTASIRLGAMSANTTPARLKNLTEFGQALGLAFQVIDDMFAAQGHHAIRPPPHCLPQSIQMLLKARLQ